jgi:hypothetical protein
MQHQLLILNALTVYLFLHSVLLAQAVQLVHFVYLVMPEVLVLTAILDILDPIVIYAREGTIK